MTATSWSGQPIGPVDCAADDSISCGGSIASPCCVSARHCRAVCRAGGDDIG